jgi:hypothetical protein
MDGQTRWSKQARLYLLAGYLWLLALFAGLAIIAVAFLGVHWGLAALVFGVEALSLAVGSWFGFRSLKRRR